MIGGRCSKWCPNATTEPLLFDSGAPVNQRIYMAKVVVFLRTDLHLDCWLDFQHVTHSNRAIPVDSGCFDEEGMPERLSRSPLYF